MVRLRVAAAAAAILTVLLVQATLVSPLAITLQISVPAVLVCAVALVEGPGAGIAFGFSAGLVADLASSHPAGVLALSWLVSALVVGSLGAGPGRSPGSKTSRSSSTLVADAMRAGVGAGAATALSTCLLLVLHAGGVQPSALLLTLPSACFDVLVALALVPIVRAFLSSNALRSPRPVVTELDIRPLHG